MWVWALKLKSRFLYQLFLDFINFLDVLMHLWATECKWFVLSDRNSSLLSCPRHGCVLLSCAGVLPVEQGPDQVTSCMKSLSYVCHSSSNISRCFRQLVSCHLWSQKAVRGDTCPCEGTGWINFQKAPFTETQGWECRSQHRCSSGWREVGSSSLCDSACWKWQPGPCFVLPMTQQSQRQSWRKSQHHSQAHVLCAHPQVAGRDEIAWLSSCLFFSSIMHQKERAKEV